MKESTVKTMSITDFKAWARTTIVESPYVPDGQIIALAGKDPIDLPDGWDAMAEPDKLAWLIAHGAIVMVKNIDALKITPTIKL